MNDNKIRVAKHRVEKSLNNGKFPTENNLKTLVDAKININPYIKKFKENIDSLINRSITTDKNKCEIEKIS